MAYSSTAPVVNPYFYYRPQQPSAWNAGYPTAYYQTRPVPYPYQTGQRNNRQNNENQYGYSGFSGPSADQFSLNTHPDVYNQLSSAGRTYFVDRFPSMMQALPTATEAARTLTYNLARFFL